MKFAFRMAWLEAKASRGRFLFVILAIAIGVAALTGVKGFSESVHYTLQKEARTLMSADLMIRLNAPPRESEVQFLDELRSRGIDHTVVTETVSMTSSQAQHTPVLTSIKAADLSKYPYYGALEFEPASAQLSHGAVFVSDDLLLRLNVKVGESIKIGEQSYRIEAIIRKEPDRMTTGFTLGPRALMSREGFDRSGLNIFGTRATQRILLKLPAETNLEATRQSIRDVFGRRARVIDYSEANPTLSRNLNRATAFLSMVSLIALIVGGVGVATSIESHIQQRMDNLAIMKCLGGRSSQLVRIYVAQAIMLGAAGSIIGVTLGFAAQAVFPRFLADYFDVEIDLILSVVPAIQGLGVGLLTTLLFTIPPLLALSRIKPALIFRRNMQEKTQTERDIRPWLALLAIACGLWGIAVWMSDSLRIGSYFAGGLIISIAVLAGIAAGLLAGLGAFVNRFSHRLSPVIRQGIANLHRPGAHVTAVLVALGVGVMFTLTVQLMQTSLLDQLRLSAPPDSPNVFIVNITNNNRAELWDLVRKQEGVFDAPDPSPAVAGQLMRINGASVEDMSFSDAEQRYFRTQFALTWSETPPKSTEILDGAWWPANSKESLVSVEENVGDALRLKVGDTLEWSVAGRPLSARISSLRRTDAVRIGANNQFILTESALQGLPVVYTGTARVRPGDVANLQRTVFERFPTVTVVNAADVLEIVQQVVDRISLTVRFLSAFAILGGVIILASAVAGTRYRRMREVAILKTVGATRGKIIRIFSLEFLVMGLAAGAIGSSLAVLFSIFLVKQLFDSFFAFDPLPVLSSVLFTAVITVAAGWAASFRILSQKPLEVLRQADL